MIIQLQEPVVLQTPTGKAWAVALIDDGPYWDSKWVAFIPDKSEYCTFEAHEVHQEKTPSPSLPAFRTLMEGRMYINYGF